MGNDYTQSLSGTAFFDAFCRIEQARTIVDDVVKTWRGFDEGRPESKIERWEYAVMRETLPMADIIHRECYRISILSQFETFFSHKYEDFEVSLTELKRIYGGAS